MDGARYFTTNPRISLPRCCEVVVDLISLLTKYDNQTYHSTPDFEECGKNENSEQIQSGRNVVGIWPWMASFGVRNGDIWTHHCGASLITR